MITFFLGCIVVTIFEALIIGAIGSFLAIITDYFLIFLRVDDAVGATCVHGFAGAWGMISVGIFAAKDNSEIYCKHNGLLHGGGGYLLGVQLLSVISMTIWAMIATFLILGVRKKLLSCLTFELLRFFFTSFTDNQQNNSNKNE